MKVKAVIIVAAVALSGAASAGIFDNLSQGLGSEVKLSEKEAAIPLYSYYGKDVDSKVPQDSIKSVSELGGFPRLEEYVTASMAGLKDLKGIKTISEAKKLAASKGFDGIFLASLKEERMDFGFGVSGLGWVLKSYGYKLENPSDDALREYATLKDKGDGFAPKDAYQAMVAVDYAIRNKNTALYDISGSAFEKFSDRKKLGNYLAIDDTYQTLMNKYRHYLKAMAPEMIRAGKVSVLKKEYEIMKLKENKTSDEVELVNYIGELIIRAS